MRFNPGLQARLGVAFAAVAVLAVAANVLAERTVRVVIERRAAPSGAALPPAIVSPAVLPPSSDAVAESRSGAEEFVAAIDDYEHAVQARIASDQAAVQRQLEFSARTLDRRARDFETAMAAAPDAPRRALARDLRRLREGADAAIALADARRASHADYAAAAERLADLTRERLNDAWRVLGRVIARQRMVELRERTEELRQNVALLRETGLDEGALAQVVARETAVERLLPREGRARTGDAASWQQQLREALDEARGARETLLAGDAALRAAVTGRAGRVESVRTRALAMPAALPVAATANPEGPVPALAMPVAGAAPAEGSDVASDQVTRTDASTGHRTLLIWISAAVLLLTLAVTAFTVRSLVGQVSRLLEGIRRVARGEAARVAPGGIRELDVVAAEFNEMSRQLAQARAENARYQRELEARVAERTAQLEHQAAHDPLTQLPNRRELGRLIGQALAAAMPAGRCVGVLLVDLDNFKVVNDGMGHGFGDRVLVAMAQRLQSLVPAGGFAARLGGDEFTFVAGQAEDAAAVESLGLALVRAFQEPLSVDGRELVVGVSVGAAVFPDHGASPEALLRAADSALFRAKALGRSQLAMFAPEMSDAAESRFSTEQALRRALERGEFELLYQPEVDLATFEVQSVEALLRWRLPDGRLASPGEFLSIAEDSGLITGISDWVLREAVAAAARWHRGDWRDVRVAINVSSRQLVDLNFAARLRALLEEHDLPPSAIEIELTEHVLQTGAHTIKTLQALRAMGVPTALDDFGTGYSSLASLERLPLSRVKLDRSLVDAIDGSPRAAAIARAIISLCEGLGLHVTAEGVERITQFEMLLRHQPLMLQGFLLSRPLPEGEVAAARASIPPRLTSLLLTMPEDTQLRLPVLPHAALDEAAGTG